MEIQGQEIYYQENNNPNYGYNSPNMGLENKIYNNGQIMIYNQQEINIPNTQYSQQYNQVQLPLIYANQIESVNETHDNQIKYLDPIEFSEGLNINNYLQSGQLNQQISPKIMELKQETQHNNNPFAYTEIASENYLLNATSYMNSNYSLVNQIDYNMSKSQIVPSSQNNNYGYNHLLQNNLNRNQEGGNSIEYSSVLPAKIEQIKLANIDQYGNRLEEDQNKIGENKEEKNKEQNEEIDNDGIQNGGDNPMDNDELPNTNEHETSETENQLEFKQLQQKQQMLEQQKLQQLEQQKSQLLIQKQKIEQEILQQQKDTNSQILSSNNNTQNISPHLYENSKNRISIQKIQSFPPSNQILEVPYMNINQIKDNKDHLRKDPRVQKAVKIFGNLRPRQRIITSYDQNMAAIKIQNKWRNHFFKKRFELIKPKLIHECENFLRAQYEFCDRMGQIPSDDDFSLFGWKKFYPQNNPFFNYDKGFVIHYGVKILYPNDPYRVSIYEGDVNINNEKHGFGRLTTTKGVFLGEWRNDQFTGWGRETRRNGKILEGKYINGYIEGKGILRNNKGNSYIGDFSNSKRHGIGVLDTHKIHYEGEFKNDKLNGKGKITFKNEGHYYEGDFENNEINGYGTFKWKNGDCYTGHMLNGKMHGLGRYRYNTGQVFEGTYANGIKQGRGKIYNINNTK